MAATRATLIPGDGVGMEVIDATRRVMEAAGVQIEWDEQLAGASVFKQGLSSGVPPETVKSIHDTRLVLKGPLETPVGFGEKSANVTLRKMFETYANIRPVRELPGVETPYSDRGVDLVVVRENIEDLYAAIEHMQTPGVAQALKLITRMGSEKVIRLAFELARAEGRKSVHCATKSNILKLTEGLFKRTFEEVAPDYPDIEAQHIIIDNCAHQLVRSPEQFEVIVTTNLNGDIISDLASGLVGGLGFAPSANLGSDVAIFEAVHGSAPKYAGKNVINPTAMILTGVMMLRHIGQFEPADAIEKALLVTLEEGKNLTRDIVGDERAASTTEFTDTIIENLGRSPAEWEIREYKPIQMPKVAKETGYIQAGERQTAGADIFIESPLDVDALGRDLERLSEGTALQLKMISNRGMMVYPDRDAETDYVDHWRCRFVLRQDGDLQDNQLLELLQRISGEHIWMHVEKLPVFDGEAGYTLAQGED